MFTGSGFRSRVRLLTVRGCFAKSIAAVRRERLSPMAKPEEMWQCQTVSCGYIYNPDKGDRKGKIPKGTLFDDLPEDWRCPICGAGRKMFKPLAGPGSVVESGG